MTFLFQAIPIKKLCKTIQEVNPMKEPIFRRFKLLYKGAQRKAFLALIKQKGLTREDLMMILSSVKLQSAFSK